MASTNEIDPTKEKVSISNILYISEKKDGQEKNLDKIQIANRIEKESASHKKEHLDEEAKHFIERKENIINVLNKQHEEEQKHQSKKLLPLNIKDINVDPLEEEVEKAFAKAMDDLLTSIGKKLNDAIDKDAPDMTDTQKQRKIQAVKNQATSEVKQRLDDEQEKLHHNKPVGQRKEGVKGIQGRLARAYNKEELVSTEDRYEDERASEHVNNVLSDVAEKIYDFPISILQDICDNKKIKTLNPHGLFAEGQLRNMIRIGAEHIFNKQINGSSENFFGIRPKPMQNRHSSKKEEQDEQNDFSYTFTNY